MVEVEQIITMYASYKDCGFDNEDIEFLNKKFVELEINVKVIQERDDDGFTLMFKKTEI